MAHKTATVELHVLPRQNMPQYYTDVKLAFTLVTIDICIFYWFYLLFFTHSDIIRGFTGDHGHVSRVCWRLYS